MSDNNPRKSNEFSGFIILRMDARIESAEVETLQDLVKVRKLPGLAAALQTLGQPKTKRAIWSLPISTIQQLERQASQTRWKPRHSAASYWRIDARAVWPLVDQVLERLNEKRSSESPEVDFAYKELTASAPIPVAPGDDDHFVEQGYLAAAPLGIDAQAAWALGANGSGIKFIDLEMGWYTEHEDLQPPKPVVFGENFVDGPDHGTSVLGIVLGNDNNLGIVGVAPGVSSAELVSHYHAADDSRSEVANAIYAAIPRLQAGDVLLLEVQKGSRPKPTEVEDLDFEAIQAAVAQGIIVIEAAGNGGRNLDRLRSENGNRILNNSPAFDSGAIMVGACRQPVEQGRHSRLPDSNYGSRVNCYAWGEGIMTTTASYGDPETNIHFASRYANLFGGTSGASAIIAGTAILLQSLHLASKGTRLLNVANPLSNVPDMRTALSANVNGTGQRIMSTASSSSDRIGVMPDLRKIIANLHLA